MSRVSQQVILNSYSHVVQTLQGRVSTSAFHSRFLAFLQFFENQDLTQHAVDPFTPQPFEGGLMALYQNPDLLAACESIRAWIGFALRRFCNLNTTAEVENAKHTPCIRAAIDLWCACTELRHMLIPADSLYRKYAHTQEQDVTLTDDLIAHANSWMRIALASQARRQFDTLECLKRVNFREQKLTTATSNMIHASSHIPSMITLFTTLSEELTRLKQELENCRSSELEMITILALYWTANTHSWQLDKLTWSEAAVVSIEAAAEQLSNVVEPFVWRYEQLLGHATATRATFQGFTPLTWLQSMDHLYEQCRSYMSELDEYIVKVTTTGFIYTPNAAQEGPPSLTNELSASLSEAINSIDHYKESVPRVTALVEAAHTSLPQSHQLPGTLRDLKAILASYGTSSVKYKR